MSKNKGAFSDALFGLVVVILIILVVARVAAG